MGSCPNTSLLSCVLAADDVDRGGGLLVDDEVEGEEPMAALFCDDDDDDDSIRCKTSSLSIQSLMLTPFASHSLRGSVNQCDSSRV